MKRFISIFTGIMLVFGLSLNLYAQSAEEELDQVKLAKQFIGTWEMEVGEDSISQFICTSTGAGLLFKGVNKSDGKIYSESAGVLGFSPDSKTLEITVVWPNRMVTHDIGRFVTKNKLVVERFLLDLSNHSVAIYEYDFSSPNSYTYIGRGRDQNISWEPPVWESKGTFTKVD